MPERVYIGSASEFGRRFRMHRSALLNNKHVNPKLQHHYDKYGDKDLVFSVVKACSEDELTPINGVIEIEQSFMYLYREEGKSIPYFNICPTAGSCKGMVFSGRKLGAMSQAHKDAVSKGLKEFYQTERGKELAEEISKRSKGHKKPEGFGEKVSRSHKGEKHYLYGKKMPQETRDKMSAVRKGKKPSPESIQKAVLSRKKTMEGRERKPLSPETLEKMRQAQLGRKHSEETKKKISEGNKGKRPVARKEKVIKEPRPPINRKWSEERKRDASIKRKKQFAERSDEYKEWWRGMTKMAQEAALTEESRQKRRDWNLNREPFTEEHCKNISEGLKKSPKHAAHPRDIKTGRYL